MNDDFLHRPRKSPRPEFLRELKARLDRQPLFAPPARRRPHFAKGLLAGLLLGGTAFVFAVIEGKGIVPESVRSAVLAPAHWVARLVSNEPKSTAADARHIESLGPAWLPTRHMAVSQTPTAPSKSTGSAPSPPSSPTTATAAAPPFPTATSDTTIPNRSVAPPTYTIVADNSVYSIVSKVSASSGRVVGRVNVEHETDESIAEVLCGPARGGTKATMVVYARHLTDDELRGCRSNNVSQSQVVKVGYTALALARSRLYGPLRLTSRDLFLALAQRIPDPNHPDSFIDNPNLTWNQVNPALSYDRIRVLGPPPDSDRGRLTAELLLETGCKNYSGASEEICHTLRSDGAYMADAVDPSAYIERLAGDPTLLGVMAIGDLRMWAKDKLAVSPIDDVELGSAGYPASRAVYLSARAERNGGLATMAQIYLLPSSLNYGFGFDWYVWGFMSLDATERAASIAKLRAWGFNFR